MSRLADNATYYAINLVPSYEVEHEVAMALANVRRMENRHILTNTDEEMDAVEAKIAGYRKTIAAAFDRYAKDLVSDDTDKAALDQARAAVDAYCAEWDEIRKASRKTGSDPAMTAVATKLLLGVSNQKYDAAHAAVGKWWD